MMLSFDCQMNNSVVTIFSSIDINLVLMIPDHFFDFYFVSLSTVMMEFGKFRGFFKAFLILS
eukprot:10415.XXX_487390_487572_1 [CDS] Oithona nana genome sequencing.